MQWFDLTGPVPPLAALEGGWIADIVMIGIYAAVLWKGVNIIRERFFRS
jgi:hypothetical protein